MIKADVPQDVTEYKEQFFFGMNSRQLICSVLMIVVAVLVFLVGSKFISTDILVYITIALIAPLAAVGFLKYNGMGFEKIAATVAEFYVSNQRRRMEYLPDEITQRHRSFIRYSLEMKKSPIISGILKHP